MDLDVRYWERQSEKGSASRSTDASRDTARGKSTSTPSSSSTSRPASATGTPAYVSRLNTDGRLLDAERQRRREQGLCLYCGRPGHTYANCRKRLAAGTSSSSTTTINPSKLPPASSISTHRPPQRPPPTSASTQVRGRAIQPLEEAYIEEEEDIEANETDIALDTVLIEEEEEEAKN